MTVNLVFWNMYIYSGCSPLKSNRNNDKHKIYVGYFLDNKTRNFSNHIEFNKSTSKFIFKLQCTDGSVKIVVVSFLFICTINQRL